MAFPTIEIDPGLNKITLRFINIDISKGSSISVFIQDNETEEILDRISVKIKKEFKDDF